MKRSPNMRTTGESTINWVLEQIRQSRAGEADTVRIDHCEPQKFYMEYDGDEHGYMITVDEIGKRNPPLYDDGVKGVVLGLISRTLIDDGAHPWAEDHIERIEDVVPSDIEQERSGDVEMRVHLKGGRTISVSVTG